MKLYRAKPVTVEAMQYTGDNSEELSEWAQLAEGYVSLNEGDWVIKDGGELLFVADAWLRSHYEPLVAEHAERAPHVGLSVA